ncbi:MAG TPA: DNA polymerase III subunit beta [Candidatus Enterenecus stercoripullorum]|nr:DNA polymerase III subunit beta [Candidatus Enterenecus stercoripullorum]
MKFSCEKVLLQNAVTTAGRVVAAKSSIVALEGVLLETGDNGLHISGYNLETGIVTQVEAGVVQTGSIVLPARLFGEIIRKLPDDMVSVVTDGNKVHIDCGPTSFDIMGSSAEEFPELPAVDEGNKLVMGQGALRSMISRVIFAVSDNESRPIHTGALFEVSGDELTMVAVDGYRLALRREKIVQKDGADQFSFVVPGAALNEVDKICADSDEAVTVTEGERHITFLMGSTLLVARRLEGEFLNYRQTIPQNNSICLEADTAALQLSIDRASLIINDKLKSPLRCRFEDGSLSITSKTAIGSAFDRCPIVGDGKGLEIGFNNRFLMEAVKAAPAGQVRLELNTPTSPCLILPKQGEADNFLYMVLPVRLKAGE